MNGKAASRIYLIRHGETANAGEVCFNGHFDIDLSDEGKKQSILIAKSLKKLPIKAIYSSDLKRTQIGAKFIADELNLSHIPCQELRELAFGDWEGLSISEVNLKYPDKLKERLQNIELFQVEGGETIFQLKNRVIPKFKSILANHPSDSIVILCHGGVIRIILAYILEISVKNLFRINQPYASVNIIQYYEGGDPVVDLMGGSHCNIGLSNSPDKKISIQ
jgi:alpha-ribazole phosphatase